MFNKKLKNQLKEKRAALCAAIQGRIDTVLKIEDAGKRYDALSALSAEITTQKPVFHENCITGKEVATMMGPITLALPAAYGTKALLGVWLMADVAMTGGALSIGVLGGFSIYKATQYTSEWTEKGSFNRAVSDDCDAFLEQIVQHQESLLEKTAPEQLLSSDSAKQQLVENLKKKFLEEARRKLEDDCQKQAEQLLSSKSLPLPPKKNPELDF